MESIGNHRFRVIKNWFSIGCLTTLLMGVTYPLAASVNPVDSVAYQSNYKFKEGIYLNFDQFKMNNPLVKDSIITTISKKELNFWSNLTEQKKISFKNGQGTNQEIKSSELWGYSNGNAVFVNHEGIFCRLGIIGSLGHFFGSVVQSTMPMNTGMGFYDPYGRATPSYYRVQKPFVIDLNTNEVQELTSESMLKFLSADEKLFTEYQALKRRQREDFKFLYIRKFNELHPFYLPAP